MKANLKTYTITTWDEGGMNHMNRKNDGFTPLELIGLSVMISKDIIQQMEGLIKPEVITRQVVKRNIKKAK